jgi:hypothetical protein
MASHSTTTTDHDQIRKWVEERGGKPACVKERGSKDDPGLLRIDFPGGAGEDRLQTIDWDEFFEKFDENRLAFLHQDRTADGDTSRFFKFVRRDH